MILIISGGADNQNGNKEDTLTVFVVLFQFTGVNPIQRSSVLQCVRAGTGYSERSRTFHHRRCVRIPDHCLNWWEQLVISKITSFDLV